MWKGGTDDFSRMPPSVAWWRRIMDRWLTCENNADPHTHTLHPEILVCVCVCVNILKYIYINSIYIHLYTIGNWETPWDVHLSLPTDAWEIIATFMVPSWLAISQGYIIYVHPLFCLSDIYINLAFRGYWRV